MPRDRYYAQMLRNKRAVIVPPYNRLSVFSSDTIDQIIRVLRLQLQSEILAENLRKNITSKKWINFYEVFEEIDKDRDGMITIGEFQDVFIRHSESPSITELEILVERYDKDFDRRVSYSEFIEEITPKLFN
jgi:Ca2+-binding EF-hand superfamily protein